MPGLKVKSGTAVRQQTIIFAGSILVALGFVGLLIQRSGVRDPNNTKTLNPSTKKLPKIYQQRAEYRRSLARLIHCNLARALPKLDYAIFCEILSLLFGRVLIST